MAPLFSVNKYNDSVNDGAVINFTIIQCTNQHRFFKVFYELQILRLYVCLLCGIRRGEMASEGNAKEIPKRESDDLTNSFEARKRVCCLCIATNKQQVHNKSGNYKNSNVYF